MPLQELYTLAPTLQDTSVAAVAQAESKEFCMQSYIPRGAQA